MPSSNCHFLPCIQVSQEAVINIYTLNVGAPKYIKQLLIGTKGRNWQQHNQFNCSVQHNSSIQLFSHVLLFATLWTAACQASISISKSQACSNSCSSSRWCYPTILSSVVPFSFCLQSFPASGSFPVSLCQFFTLGGQSIRISASASVLPMNIRHWFPWGWTDWVSLQSKELSRVFSNTQIQKHQFFSAQLSLWSNSHIHTWLLEIP